MSIAGGQSDGTADALRQTCTDSRLHCADSVVLHQLTSVKPAESLQNIGDVVMSVSSAHNPRTKVDHFLNTFKLRSVARTVDRYIVMHHRYN